MRKKILIVDDCEVSRALLKYYLENDYSLEFSFHGNVNYKNNEEAKLQRDLLWKKYRVEGYKCRRSCLYNQLHKYFGLCDPDGRIGHVYYLVVLPKDEEGSSPPDLQIENRL